MSNSLLSHGLQPTRLLCPWNSPGKNTGVGNHFLLQGIFPTQGMDPGLLHCRQILCCLSHQGNHLKCLNIPYTSGATMVIIQAINSSEVCLRYRTISGKSGHQQVFSLHKALCTGSLEHTLTIPKCVLGESQKATIGKGLM